jgi:mannosyl-oligosaccharide alpha-1,2-mannosidase
MPAIRRRLRIVALSVLFVITTLYYLTNQRNTWNYGYTAYIPSATKSPPSNDPTHWSKLPERFPVTSFKPLPTNGSTKKIHPVQTAPPSEDPAQKAERLRKRDKVKESFIHSWEGYKTYAWLRDEVAPISAGWKDTFGGWAATLVDSLDTLWILGLKEDFETAVSACQHIDFSTTDTKYINVFETTIRYMGGFLAAYDISGGNYPVLLLKAVEVGDFLMSSFDTPNRMPITRWDWKKYV